MYTVKHDVVSTSPGLLVRFEWPEAPVHPYREVVFLGAWHPDRALRVEVGEPPPNIVPASIAGYNWFLTGNTTPGGAPLVHRCEGDAAGQPDAIAFRGYVLDPPLHAWSSPDTIARYWSSDRRHHNGVFSVAIIDRGGSRLRLVSDAFSISPLFYRRLESGLVLFATAPRYLVLPGDDVDPVAARTLFHMQGLCGSISLVPGARRLAPGASLEFQGDRARETRWFHLGSLPPGDEPIDERALVKLEEVFQVAIDRCLNLMPGGPIHLPLSSGYDSRRILAALIARKAQFVAETVRILQKDNRDLDARFAAELARRFDFPHRVFEPGEPQQYRRDDHDCRILFGSEVTEHTWLAPLIKSIESSPSLLFDGLGGDQFGEEPWEAVIGGRMATELYRMDESERLEAMARFAIPDVGSHVLEARAWTPLEGARANLATFTREQGLPEGENYSGLALILFRVCRSTALWSHHLIPSACVPVFPYLDMDNVVTMLRYRPADRLQKTIQDRCLERFWPDFHAVPGSRRIPEEIQPGSPTAARRLKLARLDRLREECGELSPRWLADRIRVHYRALAIASRMSRQLSLRIQWWLDPLLMLGSEQLRMRRGCWHVDDGSDATLKASEMVQSRTRES